MRSRKGIVAAIGAVLMATVALALSADAADHTACETDQLRKQSVSGGIVPVVLIHGFTSSGAMWNEEISMAIDTAVVPAGRSFAEQVQRIRGAAVWVFDYEQYATLWVDDDNIDSSLREGIECLSEIYGTDVILVGHSMGGLAIRQALDELDDPTGQVAGVVTFGTPHIGSVLAWAADAVLLPDLPPSFASISGYRVIRNALSFCAAGPVTKCDEMREFFDASLVSDAGLALRLGSTQLRKLPVYPQGIPTLSVAGQIEIVFQGEFGLFYRDIADIRLGDILVPASSALALGDELVERTCRVNLREGWAVSDTFRDDLGLFLDVNDQRSGLLAVLGNPCMHTSLTRGAELTNQALGFISDLIAARVVDVPGPAIAARDDAIAYAVSYPGGSTLWQITPTSDHQVGQVRRESGSSVELTDVSIGPAGNLLGVSYSGLFDLDPWSAQITAIGNVGFFAVNALDTSPDGTLHASSAGSFLRVDPSTGTGQSIGSFGPGLASSGDLAFSPDGPLYATVYRSGTDVLLRVDPRTAAGAVVGEIAVSDVWGLFFHEGDLYGLSADTSSCGSGRGQMIMIDTTTAASTHVRCLEFLPGGATNGVGP